MRTKTESMICCICIVVFLAHFRKTNLEKMMRDAFWWREEERMYHVHGCIIMFVNIIKRERETSSI